MLSVAVAIPANAATVFKKPEVVVLIHGLLRTTLSMLPLKLYLEHQGYEVKYYSYISARYSIHEHGMALRQYINQLEASNPNQKIHFVTHSLGGIILREALATQSSDQLKHIGYAVMLAPPNQGSELARFSTKAMPLFNYFVKPLPELSSDPKAYVHKVPLPKFKMGIIAGRYDAKVPPASAQLQGQKKVAIVNTTHTFIMVKPKTMKLVLHFLQNGNFA
ncbi:MAG: lipase [Legionella sp.]|jgi:pimeloyl-ACP methyl ester carboxylesterase